MNERTVASFDEIFGPGQGNDIRARAVHSDREYIRSIDQIAYAREGARGRRLTALEALNAYGLDVLRTVADEGSALLAADADAAGRALRERRTQLKLTSTQVARRAGLSPEVVEAMERSCRRPVREYEKVARVLGLDERMLSFRAGPIGNDRIAVRLRTLQQNRRTRLSAPTVGALAEAAWVAATQIRLEQELGLGKPDATFEQSSDYGSPGWPAWRVGFELATKVRTQLALGDTTISSLRDLCERRLHVPVIQAELGEDIAGATVESDGHRAVVLNLTGRNRDVFVRRATLAHELGHILFDPPRRLDDLRVDRYDELERSVEQLVDPVEQRANAFAVEFIAPQSAAVQHFQTQEDETLRGVMDHFGISFTAARFQVWNGLARQIPLTALSARNQPPDPFWEGQESYTVDFHPLRSLSKQPSRAGRFSALTLRAAQERYISWDTAAEWLLSSIDEIREAEQSIRNLYPAIFSS